MEFLENDEEDHQNDDQDERDEDSVEPQGVREVKMPRSYKVGYCGNNTNP